MKLALARHGLAILVFPFTVTVVIPVWLGRGLASTWPPEGVAEWSAALFGILLGAAGIALFVSTVDRFGREGRGTLAPWDPPDTLVVSGPYSYVRNPMISGVVLILLAEALVLRSPVHFWWAAIFFGINALYIPLLEEPMLRARFGDSYDEYRRAVPRLIPRWTPWRR